MYQKWDFIKLEIKEHGGKILGDVSNLIKSIFRANKMYDTI